MAKKKKKKDQHGRPDADRFRVRGFIEQGTTTTPFDMTVRNRASRYREWPHSFGD